MTLTDAMMGAAALWLLYMIFGSPGHRAAVPGVSRDGIAAAGVTADRPVDVAPYSVWYQDVPQPRHVTPPLPTDGAPVGDVGEVHADAIAPVNAYSAMGSATVHAVGLPQMLSLTEVTIAPGSSLTLANLGGSGLIVLETGWLELAERDGNAALTRAPDSESAPPQDDESRSTIAPGDRLSFGPGATIVLHNRSEHPAQILAASVVAMPALAA